MINLILKLKLVKNNFKITHLTKIFEIKIIGFLSNNKMILL